MLKDRSMTLRRLYCRASKPAGRPPRLPRRRRLSIWIDDSGMTAQMPRARSRARGCARREGLITQHRSRSSTRPTRAHTGHAQLAHQRVQHRRIMRVARTDVHHQRQSLPGAELMDLRRQPARATAPERGGGFIAQIRVIRWCPLCHAPGSRRADAPDTMSSQPPPPTYQ